MAIPDFKTIMLPLLKFLSDKEEHIQKEAVDVLAKQFNLTQEELNQLQPSGRNFLFANRVAWARFYMSKAGLVSSPQRGYWQITDKGLEILKSNPPKIDVNFLDKIPGFKEIRTGKRGKEQETKSIITETQKTPEELIDAGYQEIRQSLIEDLLIQISRCSPSFFEKLVVELLLKMGYGGSREDAAEAIGRIGDEGIDGIIKEDRLGLDCIYIQAKRWQSQVGRPEIQKFVGALHGKHAQKGIFITTSMFSQEALDYAKNMSIILIDGETLAQFMIDYNVGVTSVASYEIKRVDSDYFVE